MFRNMKLSAKIGAGFAALLLVALCIGTAGWLGLRGVGEQNALALEQAAAAELLKQTGMDRRDLMLSITPEQSAKAEAAWQENFDAMMAILRGLDASPKLSSEAP